jgi:hypothetical protein
MSVHDRPPAPGLGIDEPEEREPIKASRGLSVDEENESPVPEIPPDIEAKMGELKAEARTKKEAMKAKYAALLEQTAGWDKSDSPFRPEFRRQAELLYKILDKSKDCLILLPHLEESMEKTLGAMKRQLDKLAEYEALPEDQRNDLTRKEAMARRATTGFWPYYGDFGGPSWEDGYNMYSFRNMAERALEEDKKDKRQ